MHLCWMSIGLMLAVFMPSMIATKAVGEVVPSTSSSQLTALPGEIQNRDVLRYIQFNYPFSKGVPCDISNATERSTEKVQADQWLKQGCQQIGYSSSIYFLSSKYVDSSPKLINQALQLYRKLGDRSGEADALTHLGKVFIALERYPTALDTLQTALRIRQQLRDRKGEVKTLHVIGSVYLAQGEKQLDKEHKQAALQCYQQALKLYQDIQDYRGQFDALEALVNFYLNSNFPKALEYAQQQLTLTHANRNYRNEASVWMGLNSIYLKKGNYGKALEVAEQLLALLQACSDTEGVSPTLEASVSKPSLKESVFVVLVDTYDALGDQVKAEEYRLRIIHEVKLHRHQAELQQALVSFIRALAHGDRKTQLVALSNLGIWQTALGKNYYDLKDESKAKESFNQTQKYYEQGIGIAREIGTYETELYFLRQLGDLYFYYEPIRDYPKALEYYQQLLALAQRKHQDLAEGTALWKLGKTHQLLGNDFKAVEYYEQFVPKKPEAESYKYDALEELTKIYLAQKNYPKALQFARQGLNLAREENRYFAIRRTLHTLGTVLQQMGSYQKAQNAYQLEVELAQRRTDFEHQIIGLNSLANLSVEQKQPEAAINFYKQAVNLIETIRQDLRKFSREQQEAYLQTVGKTYRALADLLLKQGRIDEAQKILERLKVQEIHNYINRDRAASSQRAQTTNSNQGIGNIKNIIAAQPGTLLIQNLVLPDKLWVLWTTTKGKTKVIVVPVTQAQLNTTVEKFRKLIQTPYSDLKELQATGQQLYNWLIPKELQAELSADPMQNLVFCLDHVTRYVPTAALFDGKQYLTERYTISSMITTDTDMSDRLHGVQNTSVLALGLSKSQPGFAALPNVPAELSAIVRESGSSQGIYPGLKRLNDAFTWDALRNNLSGHQILHIATHGKFESGNVTNSFLLLGDGKRLLISQIEQLQLNNLHLVVLSACETALSGLGQDGTEISGISSYFFHQGAKSVMASLWSVNDTSTSQLMQQFYTNLSKSTEQAPITKAAALRRAQLMLLKNPALSRTDANRTALHPNEANQETRRDNQPSAPGFTHPYYWAPFILIGNSL